ncbi:MAG: hypothetical protein ACREQM_08105 [Candidatus Dormibacteraceae bacterium]
MTPLTQPRSPELGVHVDLNTCRLRESLAGLELGTYNEHVMRRLAGLEPSTVEMIATWIDRAARLYREERDALGG